MKSKLSISMDEKTLSQLEEAIKDGRFRNKSHVIEYAVKTMLEKRS